MNNIATKTPMESRRYTTKYISYRQEIDKRPQQRLLESTEEGQIYTMLALARKRWEWEQLTIEANTQIVCVDV